ncbi:MAG: hypothetical protein K2N89_14795 [Lachnospiraceae bacterium]|nr:hypothetical protein [Lachnospiraceae bacterium]
MKGRQLLDAMAYIDDELIENAAPFVESAFADTARPPGQTLKWRSITACAAVFFVVAVSLWVWKSGANTVYKESVPQEGANAGGVDTGAALAQNPTENVPMDAGREVGVDHAAAAVEIDDKNDAAVLDDTVDEFAAAVEEDKDFAADSAGQKNDVIVRVIEEFPLQSEVCYKAPSKESFMIWLGLEKAIDYYDNANNTIELEYPENYLYLVAIDVFGDVTQNGETVYEELRFSEEGKEKLYQEYERMLEAGLDVSLSEEYELTGLLNREEIEGFAPCADYGYAFRLVTE